MNSDPFPYSLSQLRLPPISSANLLEISSPSPVPWIPLFFSSSSLSYAVKSFSLSSSFTPIPVSFTEKRSLHSSSFLSSMETERANPPVSVYFTAFVRRFNTICLIFPASPYIRLGNTSSMTTSNVSSFSVLRTLIIETTDLSTSCISYSCSTRCILPDSILDMSSKSFISDNSDSAAFFISKA